MGTIESVWDYPRPPRVEPTEAFLRVIHHGVTVAATCRAQRVLETSHPPVLLASIARRSFCEFKGVALYWDLAIPDEDAALVVSQVGWSYPEPSPRFAPLRDHIAFYASRVDECWVGEERVQPQVGEFYGGWITSAVRGPFKGGPGTLRW